jgi:hypothetical protein
MVILIMVLFMFLIGLLLMILIPLAVVTSIALTLALTNVANAILQKPVHAVVGTSAPGVAATVVGLSTGAIAAAVALLAFAFAAEMKLAWYWGYISAAVLSLPSLFRSIAVSKEKVLGDSRHAKGAMLLALATLGVAFFALKVPTPHWQKFPMLVWAFYVRTDGSGRVTGLQGDATRFIGLNFNTNDFQTLDVKAVLDDRLIVKDWFYTKNRDVTLRIRPEHQQLYRELFFQVIPRQLGQPLD